MDYLYLNTDKDICTRHGSSLFTRIFMSFAVPVNFFFFCIQVPGQAKLEVGSPGPSGSPMASASSPSSVARSSFTGWWTLGTLGAQTAELVLCPCRGMHLCERSWVNEGGSAVFSDLSLNQNRMVRLWLCSRCNGCCQLILNKAHSRNEDIL